MGAVRLIMRRFRTSRPPARAGILIITSIAVRQPIPYLALSNAIRGAVTGQDLARRTHELSDFLVNDACTGRMWAAFRGQGHLSHGLSSPGLGLAKRAGTPAAPGLRGLEYLPLERRDECCGFGGSLRGFPGISGAMVQDKAAFIEKTGADVVVATDAGGPMNIAGCLRRRGGRRRPVARSRQRQRRAGPRTVRAGGHPVPFPLLRRLTVEGLSQEQVLVILAGVYLLIRYGLSALFECGTVHRGMFHSIPGMLIAGLLVFVAYHHPHLLIRLFLAGGIMLGFLSHLVLDELCSVDLSGARLRLTSTPAVP